MTDEELRARALELHEELHAKIEEYLGFIAEQVDDFYVESWALTALVGRYNDPGVSAEYAVETYPLKQPPHSVKGLFYEGIDEVDNWQHGGQ